MSTLHALLEAAPGTRVVRGDAATVIRGLCLDSRRVEPGFLFAALPGRRTDGGRFAADAVGRGAVAVLAGTEIGIPPGAALVVADDPRAALAAMARRFFGAPDERLDVIGVTGTDGKTSTVALIRAALDRAGVPTAVAGTLGRAFGESRLPATLTTPEAPELWAFLAEAADRGARAAAIEVSSVALAERRVHGMRFRGAVLTSIGRDHLDYHGTEERYVEAKRELFRGLDADAFAVLVRSARGCERFAGDAAPARVVTVGTDDTADWRVTDHRPSATGAAFRLTGPGFDRQLHSPRPAPWDALNIATAVATAAALGADPCSAAAGATALDRIPGRWEPVDEGQPFAAIVDYAHTPDAVERVTALARSIGGGRVIVVLGAGGQRDAGKRRPMGRAAGRHADLVIVTDDNPRDEDPEAIAAPLVAGAREAGAAVERIAARDAAIGAAVEAAAPGDIVLVLGKGHESTQQIGAVLLPSEDRELLRCALRRAREVS